MYLNYDLLYNISHKTTSKVSVWSTREACRKKHFGISLTLTILSLDHHSLLIKVMTHGRRQMSLVISWSLRILFVSRINRISNEPTHAIHCELFVQQIKCWHNAYSMHHAWEMVQGIYIFYCRGLLTAF